MGASLYRLPSSCHADSLIPAVRFFRKEKSFLLRVEYFLHRIGVSAQGPLETFCVAVSAPHVGMNFFFTKKWVGGRSSLREVPARQGDGRKRPSPPPSPKDGNPRGRIPLAGARGRRPRGLSSLDHCPKSRNRITQEKDVRAFTYAVKIFGHTGVQVVPG